MTYCVDDSGILEFDIDWEYNYGKLSSGKYHLVKEIVNTKTGSDYLYLSYE